MLDEIEKAPRAGGAFSELPLHSGAGNSGIKPPRQNTQIKFQDTTEVVFDPEFTCESMRADELRGCLIREISRTMAIGLQAQAALLDDDDDLALDNLRRHWRVTRASITPLACELAALRRARGAPMNGQRQLRLVEPRAPQPRCRYEARIVVSSARMPIGRSRNFHLSDSDLERLIATAERLEARA